MGARGLTTFLILGVSGLIVLFGFMGYLIIVKARPAAQAEQQKVLSDQIDSLAFPTPEVTHEPAYYQD